MTSMLEQAVLDAEQLKEAARRNAEQFVVEKYASDIESAVQKLLEGSEIPHQVRFGHEDLVNEIPGVKDKIKEDTKEEENDEVLKVNMKSIVPDDQLKKDEDDEFLNNLFENLDITSFEDDSIDDDSDELGDGEEEDENLFEEKELLLDDEDEEEGFTGESEETTENEIHLTDDQVDELSKAINEEIKVNLTSIDLDGWLGSTQAQKDEAHEIASALDAVKGENKNLKKELEEAKKARQKLEKELLNLKESVEKSVKEIKTKLDDYSTKNGILYYSNKILKSTNLSNMQKEKIVESLERCASLKDAKLIYDTLQNGVGNTKKEPKSLHEVHSKNEGIFAKPILNENRKVGNDNVHLFDTRTIEAMQKRAGIIKKEK